jgi:class 3 adenylate cyclase
MQTIQRKTTSRMLACRRNDGLSSGSAFIWATSSRRVTDLMGDGVNITAQLEGIAKPDAICLAVSEPRRADDKNKQMGWGSQTRLI